VASVEVTVLLRLQEKSASYTNPLPITSRDTASGIRSQLVPIIPEKNIILKWTVWIVEKIQRPDRKKGEFKHKKKSSVAC
jgi:hypothetical protein